MTQRSVTVCLFAYSGTVHIPVMNSLFSEIGKISATTGWPVHLSTRMGDAMLPRARNAAVSEFLAGNSTDLIMIDDDNNCDAGGLLKMLQAPVDVVALPCRSRIEQLNWPIRWLTGQAMERDSATGLVEVESVGTGIIKFSRACLERMVEAIKDDWYHDPTSQTAGKSWPVFFYEIKSRHWWGEDHYFGTRWRDLGGKVWIDPDVRTNHHGTHNFSASVAGWLIDQPAQIQITDVRDGSVNVVGNSLSAQHRGADPVIARTWPRLVTESKSGKVAMCVASRGRPVFLNTTVEKMLARADLTDTRIVVGLDRDDVETMRVLETEMTALRDPRVVVSIADREDTLGAKYNRCQRATDADVYMLGVDMVAPATQGWDAVIRDTAGMFEDGIGAIYFGRQGGPLDNCNHVALTKGFIEHLGYFLPPLFPFWWHETWIDEIAKMVGRAVYAPVAMDSVPAKKTRGCREVDFWANFFDKTRSIREDLAMRIINSDAFGDPSWRKVKLIQEMPSWGTMLRMRESHMRDPNSARAIEQQHAFDAEPDARYERVKQSAIQLMATLAQPHSVAA